MIKSIIIDDETLARRLLKDYISKIPELELTAEFSNPLQVKSLIGDNQIDLMFLDIQMPEITGIEFLKSLKVKPITIFTTAYSEYAVQSYELDVIDYLLKPIPFERFYQAVNKAIDYFRFRTQNTTPLPASYKSELYESGYIFVKSGYKIIRINFKDILFIEGLKEYIRIHTEDQKVITYYSLQKMEELLPENYFFRVHKSYIVNLQKINSFEGNILYVAGQQVSLSKSRRNEFLVKIGRNVIS